MSDYVQAIETGIAEALRCKDDEKIINEVLTNLNEQIAKSTKHCVHIRVAARDYRRPDQDLVLIAHNPQADHHRQVLANWLSCNIRFPIRIKLIDTKEVLIATDRETFEECLKTMLSKPLIGFKFLKLMRSIGLDWTESDKEN